MNHGVLVVVRLASTLLEPIYANRLEPFQQNGLSGLEATKENHKKQTEKND